MSRLTLVSDVEVRVRAALQRSPMHAIRSLGVAHDGNSVRLTGVVETFYQKQLAQELVRPLTNPFQIVNEVEVAYA